MSLSLLFYSSIDDRTCVRTRRFWGSEASIPNSQIFFNNLKMLDQMTQHSSFEDKEEPSLTVSVSYSSCQHVKINQKMLTNKRACFDWSLTCWHGEMKRPLNLSLFDRKIHTTWKWGISSFNRVQKFAIFAWYEF